MTDQHISESAAGCYFVEYVKALSSIDELAGGLKDAALDFAEFLHEHDPKNLLGLQDTRDYFLASPQYYEFDREFSDPDEVRFSRIFRGDYEYWSVPARWFNDRDGYKAKFFERLAEKQQTAAEKRAADDAAREGNEREMYERLKAKFEGADA